jgi:ferredoxin-NADP reductase
LSGSTFKQALASLPIGGQLTLLDLAAGDFIWPDNLARPVLVARGIGITPFYSMLLDREHRALPLSAVLVHSNRPGAFVPYQKELRALSHLHPDLLYSPAVDMPTAANLLATIPDLAARTIFVSGPHKLLDLLKTPYNLPARQLKTDYFPGYSSASY